MSRQAAHNTVFASMLFLGIGMVLARGWLNDFETFVKSKVGGNAPTQPQSGPVSGLAPGGGSAGNPAGGAGGGGGSW